MLISGFRPSLRWSRSAASDVILVAVEVTIPTKQLRPPIAGLPALCHLSWLAWVFSSSLVQCKRRRQISRVKNIDSVVELSGVAFRLAPPYGRLLVRSSINAAQKQLAT